MLDKYQIIEQNLAKKNIHTDLITHVKSLNTVKEKMDILRDVCLGLPVIIVSCGPSSNIDFEKLKKIQNFYIIISVKYIRDKLLQNDIKIDFTLTSDYMLQGFNNININENDTISLHIFKDKINMKKDINVKPGGLYHHKLNFEKIIKDNSIDMLIINSKKISTNYVTCPLVHIMLEIAIPMSVFIGINNIYTIGWDGPKNNEYNYFNNGLNLKVDDKFKFASEFMHMETISKIFIKNNINLYKCIKESPIDLDFKNILNM